MKVKPFRLEEEDEKIIQKVQEEQGLKSEAAALRYIFVNIVKMKKLLMEYQWKYFGKWKKCKN